MENAVHDADRLKELQSLPLERKIQISQARIIEWYQHWNGNVVVSFSGGKDSTVLLHLVRSIYPEVKAVFSNTGLEYPEIQRHVRSIENVDIVVPSMRFDEVISTYGYPLIGKEVAEAIYYARRIRSQSVKVERERESSGYKPLRERKQNELRGKRQREDVGTSSRITIKNNSVGGQNVQSQTANRQAHRQTNPLIETSTARNRRTVLMGKMDGAREPEEVPG